MYIWYVIHIFVPYLYRVPKNNSKNKYVELDEEGGEIHFIFRDTIKINSPKPGEKLSGDEFIVSWEEVEDAAYYTVGAVVFYEPFGDRGISTRTYAKDIKGDYKFTETNAVFSINMFWMFVNIFLITSFYKLSSMHYIYIITHMFYDT